MTTSRIYVVRDEEAPENTESRSLVRAATKAQAIAYVVNARYTASVADQSALVSALGAGVKVRYATADETDTAGA